jgi:hypothetical protein
MLAAGVADHAVQVLFDAFAAGDFRGEAVVLLESLQLADQIGAPADEGVAGAVGSRRTVS